MKDQLGTSYFGLGEKAKNDYGSAMTEATGKNTRGADKWLCDCYVSSKVAKKIIWHFTDSFPLLISIEQWHWAISGGLQTGARKIEFSGN